MREELGANYTCDACLVKIHRADGMRPPAWTVCELENVSNSYVHKEDKYSRVLLCDKCFPVPTEQNEKRNTVAKFILKIFTKGATK